MTSRPDWEKIPLNRADGEQAMADDEARRKILARRTRFVVAALASAGLSGASGCCDRDEGFGQPCLSIAQPPSDASANVPVVCLAVDPDSTKGEDEEPRVCLTAPMPSSKPPTPG